MPQIRLFKFFAIFMHRCEATNEADSLLLHGDRLEFDSRRMRPPAEVTLFVQYAPSVTVTPTRPGMVQEGDKVIFLAK